MTADHLFIMLADDDEDDCMFFQDALDELSLAVSLKTVNNGEALMNYLESNLTNLPQLIFLDLNMPCKSGFECLIELKQNDMLKQLPVIIYSTSSNPEVMDELYNQGALYYIRKPAAFSKLKDVIKKAVSLINTTTGLQPKKEAFLIQP
ncbi:Regulator of RpoS [Arenibacter antarcticus]|uniref:Response regulator n=1 Tax=Arenibacter antarcticus TaxID=2040469 RepID=A0ABW5VDN6_9FLAO|nr:response regulator [Arenibacter sp. H213]MCM4168189.1 response regulator [Arenibacter sp. H213]